MLLRERVLTLMLSASDVMATVLTDERLLRLLVDTLIFDPCADRFSVNVVVMLLRVRVDTLILSASEVMLAALTVVILLSVRVDTLILS